MDLDIVSLLELLKYLNGRDTVSVCSTNRLVKKLCDKYHYEIWLMKLLTDYKITEDEIIGDPKSYYLGIENKIGFYYSYVLNEYRYNREDGRIKSVVIKLEGRKSENIKSFFVPSIDEINEKTKIVVGIVEFGSHKENIHDSVISKSLTATRSGIMQIIQDKYYDYLNVVELEQIGNLMVNDTFRVRIGGNVDATLHIKIFEVTINSDVSSK